MEQEIFILNNKEKTISLQSLL